MIHVPIVLSFNFYITKKYIFSMIYNVYNTLITRNQVLVPESDLNKMEPRNFWGLQIKIKYLYSFTHIFILLFFVFILKYYIC